MKYKGDRIGWGLWRRDWYSICSAHQESQEDCDLCMSGSYVWYITHLINSLIYKLCPNLWIWWSNKR